MPSRLHRDSHGRFARNVSPPPPEEPSPPAPTPISHPNRLQRILPTAATPLTSAVPVSEFVANIATAFNSSSPEQDLPVIPLAALADPSSPVHPSSPTRNSSRSPLPRPDFNAPGSDDPSPPAALNSAFIENT